MTLSSAAGRIGKVLSDNSPTILTALGAAGVVSTAILAAKGGYEAGRHVEASRREQNTDFSAKEVAELTWKFYIPTAFTTASTLAAILGANSISTKRSAALVSAMSITETAFRDYKAKVVEQIGSNKEQKVRDEVARESVEKNPPSQNPIVLTGRGEQLFLDRLSGRYFMSDMESVRKAQNDINYQILNHMYASLNDFYRKLGIEQTDLGEELGWTTSEPLEISTTAVLYEDRAVIAIEFHKNPIRDYYRVWN